MTTNDKKLPNYQAEMLVKQHTDESNIGHANGTTIATSITNSSAVVDEVKSIAARKTSGQDPQETAEVVTFIPVSKTDGGQDDLTVQIEIDRQHHLPSDYDNWSDSDDEADDYENANLLSKAILTFRGWILTFIKLGLMCTGGYGTRIVLLLSYCAYFIFAMYHRYGDDGSYRLLGFTILGIVIATRKSVYAGCGHLVSKMTGSSHIFREGRKRLDVVRFFTRWLLYGAVGGIMAWILIDKAITDTKNLKSVPGIIIFILISMLISSKPGQINYHTIYWSIGLQFLMSLLVIKWDFGRASVMWTQKRLDEFFNNSKEGSKFMFGDNYSDHYLIFGALPLLFFTNGMLTVLYYCGAMQFVINAIGSFLTFTLETSIIESMSVAGGIFLEGAATLAAFRPYLPTLTKSQLFLVISSCYASLGGAYLAVLSTLGVSIELLIGAMLMSAPAAFTICKLMVPENRKVKDREGGQLDSIGDEEKGKYANVLDALQTGAINMLPVVGNIAVSAFALICVIEWINQTLIWFGERVGIERLTIELISSYIFYPVSLAMGIDSEDCRRAATIFGYRVGSSNLVAFFKLTDMRQNRVKYLDYLSQTNGTGNVTYSNDDVILDQWGVTLPLGFISERSEAIMTYSLCGFSSFLSVAIHMGMLATFLPQRRRWVAEMAIPGLIAGNLANCLTGCFACIFLD